MNKALMVGVGALALVAAAAAAALLSVPVWSDDETFTLESNQDATVSGAMSDQHDVTNSNTISGSVFEGLEAVDGPARVVGVLENNGANSAINNGSTVAAIIDNCACTTNTFTVTSTAVATVSGGASAVVSGGSLNFNTVSGSAFSGFKGVSSVVQNNGPNAAINNGSTVAATISP